MSLGNEVIAMPYRPFRLTVKCPLFVLGLLLVVIWGLACYLNQTLKRDLEHLFSAQQFSAVSVIAASIERETRLRLKTLADLAQALGAVDFGAHMMHLRIVQLPQLTRQRALSPRQREALEWVADGKTTQDVALLMGVSPAMVEKHLRLAREALAVETTAQAVAKGALLNMIFQRPPEPVAQAAR